MDETDIEQFDYFIKHSYDAMKAMNHLAEYTNNGEKELTPHEAMWLFAVMLSFKRVFGDGKGQDDNGSSSNFRVDDDLY